MSAIQVKLFLFCFFLKISGDHLQVHGCSLHICFPDHRTALNWRHMAPDFSTMSSYCLVGGYLLGTVTCLTCELLHPASYIPVTKSKNWTDIPRRGVCLRCSLEHTFFLSHLTKEVLNEQ